MHPDRGQVTMARADFPGSGTIFVQGYGPQSHSIALVGAGTGFWDRINQATAPYLTNTARNWLADAITTTKGPSHPWLSTLKQSTPG